MIEDLGRLRRRPDVILVDGQGIAHPRGIGIASHIGVVLDISAIGCAKQRLVGDYQEVGTEQGNREPLRYRISEPIRCADILSHKIKREEHHGCSSV